MTPSLILTAIFAALFQVAVKVIDKGKLNHASLNKVSALSFFSLFSFLAKNFCLFIYIFAFVIIGYEVFH